MLTDYETDPNTPEYRQLMSHLESAIDNARRGAVSDTRYHLICALATIAGCARIFIDNE
jgi:hypothetical protein